MAQNNESKDRPFFLKLCSVLINILIIPVVIIAFLCAFTMMSSKANNKVPSIFGNSVVQVLTDSMEPTYKVGEVLIIDQDNATFNEVEVGTPIAFYAPKQSGWVDDNGNSLVIFHRVVRKITVDGINYFVCHGDNVSGLNFEPAQDPNGGDYKIDETGEYVLSPGGGYVVKIQEWDISKGDYDAGVSHSVLQIVRESDYIGRFKAKLNPILTALIHFCTSVWGIVLLVIVPCAILIIMIITSLVKETKYARQKEEEEEENIQTNVTNVYIVNELGKDDNIEPQPQPEEEPEEEAEEEAEEEPEEQPEEETQEPEPQPEPQPELEKVQKVAPKIPPAKKAPVVNKDANLDVNLNANVSAEPAAPATPNRKPRTKVKYVYPKNSRGIPKRKASKLPPKEPAEGKAAQASQNNKGKK